MKKFITIIILMFLFTVSPALARDGIIKQLPSIYHGTQYMFTVFGDTRTSETGSLDGHDVAFSLARNEVFKSINEQLSSQKAAFSLFTGDLIWQGGKLVFWEEPKAYFSQSIRRKIYPTPGNHETWKDPLLSNYFNFFPHLEKNHSYYFTCGNSLFISICTGGYIGEYSKELAFEQDRKITCTQADYIQLQLPSFLETTADNMAKSGTPLKNIFVQYHKPSFSYYKHPPLDKKSDPVEALRAFAQKNEKVQILVFNGHNHTTELYQPAPNIMVLVAGGGGAPQKVLSQDLPSVAVKEIYEEKGVKEVFWKALGSTTEKRTMRINYWTVEVDNTVNKVIVTEKVLTFTGREHVFVNGLTIVNGQI